jgi:hypothetical protein
LPGNVDTIFATDTSTNSTFYPVFVPAVGSEQTAFADDPNLRYIPFTGTLFANAASLIGNVTSGNVVTNGSGGTITGASLITAVNISASGTIIGGTIISQGSISGTSLSVGIGNITCGNIINANANGVGNIGSQGNSFNTVFANTVSATATFARYADLAENYDADGIYLPGTVVVFGGTKEITVTQKRADARVAGAVSTNPAYLMNTQIKGTPVALRGRVPIKVTGPVTKGDSLITSAASGYAESVGQDLSYAQAVFAKSLETNLDPGEKIITAVIL